MYKKSQERIRHAESPTIHRVLAVHAHESLISFGAFPCAMCFMTVLGAMQKRKTLDFHLTSFNSLPKDSRLQSIMHNLFRSV